MDIILEQGLEQQITYANKTKGVVKKYNQIE